jgi:hypothetical protein
MFERTCLAEVEQHGLGPCSSEKSGRPISGHSTKSGMRRAQYPARASQPKPLHSRVKTRARFVISHSKHLLQKMSSGRANHQQMAAPFVVCAGNHGSVPRRARPVDSQYVGVTVRVLLSAG